MENVTVRIVPLAELTGASNFQQLVDSYAEESALPVLGKPITNFASYEALAAAGALTVICAFVDETIVGFIGMLTVLSPHYGVLISSTESLYVLPDHRKGGACQKLLSAASDAARERGAVALVVSAPLNGVLDKVLPHWGFAETYRFYTKALQ